MALLLSLPPYMLNPSVVPEHMATDQAVGEAQNSLSNLAHAYFVQAHLHPLPHLHFML